MIRFNEIVERVPIELVIEQYGGRLFNGKCCCPVHDDKRPSAKIYGNKLLCFTCGRKYDSIDIIKAKGEEHPFLRLCEIGGLNICDFIDNSPVDDEKEKRMKSIRELCQLIGIKNRNVRGPVDTGGDWKVYTDKPDVVLDYTVEYLNMAVLSTNPLLDMLPDENDLKSFLKYKAGERMRIYETYADQIELFLEFVTEAQIESGSTEKVIDRGMAKGLIRVLRARADKINNLLQLI